MSTESRRVLLATGGTAGHIYAAIAVGHALRVMGEEPMVALPDERYAETIRGEGFRTLQLAAGPWQLAAPARRIRSLISTAASAFRGIEMLRRLDIGVVLGFGSYGSIAPILAARHSGVPAAILEMNAEPGLANRVTNRFADLIFTGQLTEWAGDDPRCRKTGIPIRPSIETVKRRPAPHDLVRILVLGDTHRSSSFIDENVPPVLNGVAAGRRIRVVHVAAANRTEAVRRSYEGIDVSIPSHVSEIGNLYAEADFVVARSGASTLSELALLGMPSLLIPLASASEDHQARNADLFEAAGGAVVRTELGWEVDEVVVALERILGRERLAEMSRRVSFLGRRGSAGLIAEAVLDLRG